MKVLLMLNDGMRPDYINGHKLTKFLQKNGTYSMHGKTVWPSWTLACHMSLFHSTDPEKHGVTANCYTPSEQPITGLFELLSQNGFKCAMYYDWHELRDLSRPGSLCKSEFLSGGNYGREYTANALFDRAKEQLAKGDMDFIFLYFNWPDDAGHTYGWGSDEYKHVLDKSLDMFYELTEQFRNEYRIILTADHGGHDVTHGTDLPEDMTIPIFFLGDEFEAGKELPVLSIKDIAPTIANLFNVKIPGEWEGRNVCGR